jgi:CheY-like chemotaxis protein
MEGKIWLESLEGKGSTFHFTICCEKQPGARAENILSPEPVGDLKDLSVLVVDDNETNRRILYQMTSRWGMKPLAVDSGPAALAALEEAGRAGTSYSVILTDARMPGMDGYQLVEIIRSRPPYADAKILMLTSGARRGDAQRCRELGISAYLLKPVTQAEVRSALLTLSGRGSARGGAVSSLLSEAIVRETSRKLHILVAEDNAVNQTVVLRVLKRMGHTFALAQNGEEALALATTNSEKFDLAFMDVQMPEMDGLAATRAIREYEKSSGVRLPIYAMTAHAMKGDRDRCLSAGMDGYITKPIRFGDVEKILSGVSEAGAATSRDVQAISAPGGAGRVVWRKSDVLDGLGGDENLLQEICSIFLQESPKLMQKLREGIAARDSEAVAHAAHSLKGELVYLSNQEAALAASELEDMGHEKNLSRAGEPFSLLERELCNLHLAMKDVAGVKS